ncbi:MAG TPA: toprim domain-containing protein [Chryseosolibacter sp.]
MKTDFASVKKLPIEDYLSAAGYEPAFIRGKDYWYHSPLRDERTPSFKVDTTLNLWYDHGIGVGGTLLDLGSRLHQCSIHEFASQQLESLVMPKTSKGPEKPDKESHALIVVSDSDLTSKALLQYLETRCIDRDVAAEYCRQVRFKVGAREYDAIGLRNQSGGFELRNSWFKGSSSPKDVTVISNGNNRLYVTEGFMDFLSIKQMQKLQLLDDDRADFLILNSVTMLNRCKDIVGAYQKVITFLDNDKAGRTATESLRMAEIAVTDRSGLYQGSKDLNEHLVKIASRSAGDLQGTINSTPEVSQCRAVRR